MLCLNFSVSKTLVLHVYTICCLANIMVLNADIKCSKHDAVNCWMVASTSDETMLKFLLILIVFFFLLLNRDSNMILVPIQF